MSTIVYEQDYEMPVNMENIAKGLEDAAAKLRDKGFAEIYLGGSVFAVINNSPGVIYRGVRIIA